MVLAADIGGTKSNFAVFKKENDEIITVLEFQIASNRFNLFKDLLNEVKSKIGENSIEAICFGVAGPVIAGDCKTTNLPWDIKKDELATFFNTKKVKILNDLESTAYGMLYLKDDEFVNLNQNSKKIEGNIAVIAAGTGLGEAILYFDGKSFNPIATEGGHTDFAPMTAQQDELLKFLRIKFDGHVSYERVLSGPGVSTIYDFLAQSNFAKEPKEIKELAENSDKSAMISYCAFNNYDSLCLETLRVFAEIYGAEAGNLALKSMSLGGVYIGGGVAPKILPVIENGTFFDAFIKKGTYPPMDENLALQHFNHLVEKTTNQGFVHYEISNFGKPDYYSKHNTSYWQGKSYLGIGPSAHSFYGGKRSWNVSSNTKYIQAIQKGTLPRTVESLSKKDQYNEYVMTGLRTIWGVSLERIENEFGNEYLQYLNASADKFITKNLLAIIDSNKSNQSVLATTQKGKFLVDGIASELFMI